MKDIITVSMLLIPMVSHWILPDGIERTLYINIAGLPIYIIDICYFIYIFRYKRLTTDDTCCIPSNLKWIMVISFFLFIFYSMILGVINLQNDTILKILGNNWFFFSAFIFLGFPLSEEMLQKTKWVLIPTSIIISLEVILFSTGVLTYTEDLVNNEYGGINRISTTIGAATGTAAILYMLGGIILSIYSDLDYKIKWTAISLITIAIFYTVSRGSILAWGLFLALYIYGHYIHHSRLWTKLYAIIITCFVLISLNRYQVFDPVIERQNQLVSQDMVDTYRNDKIQETLKYFEESDYLGIGFGEINIEKSLLDKIELSYGIGVHSFYYTILGETGIIGFLLIMFFILSMTVKFDYKKNITYLALIVLTLTFATEPIFVLAEFSTIAFFIFSIALKKELI